jgi:hypothetical protein
MKTQQSQHETQLRSQVEFVNNHTNSASASISHPEHDVLAELDFHSVFLHSKGTGPRVDVEQKSSHSRAPNLPADMITTPQSSAPKYHLRGNTSLPRLKIPVGFWDGDTIKLTAAGPSASMEPWTPAQQSEATTLADLCK